MRSRFSDINTSLMKSIDCLNPKSKCFLQVDLLTPLLNQYDKSLPTGNIQNEVTTLRHFILRNPIPVTDKVAYGSSSKSFPNT